MSQPTKHIETVKAALRRALPVREWNAVRLWLGTFYPYQQAWMLDPTRFEIVLKARQVGVSHTFGAAAVLWGMLGEETTVVSIGERESNEVIDKAKKHAEALTRLGSQWAEPRPKVDSIRLAGGGRVVGLPSTSAGRGYSGNIILDEFAYHSKPENVWDGAAAVVMHGHKMRVMSTPNGVGNLFHRIWSDPKASAGYSKHLVTIDDARAQGLRVDEAECWKMARGDPRVYDQLFRCSFLDNEEQYIPSDLVNGCSIPNTGLEAGDTFAGLDIGLTNDLSALCVGRLDKNRIPHVQEVETCKRTEWAKQEEMIARSFTRWKWRRMCVDSTGLGAVPAQRLMARYPGRIEPVNFTASVKEDLATRMFTHFKEQRIRINSGDALLRQDICSLRRMITAAGNVRYDAARTDDGHADRAWAVALMLMAYDQPIVFRNVSNLVI